MAKQISWYYFRKGWTSCTKAAKFLEAKDVIPKETTSASKKLGTEQAKLLLTKATKVIVAKGKKVEEFEKVTASDQNLVKKMLGPTGNLRAPTLVVGNTIVVGFNEDAYANTLT